MNLWLSIPISFLPETTYSVTPCKVFLHMKTFTDRSIGDNILSCLGEIRLPDSIKEPTQQPSKILRTPCFLHLALL